MNPFEARLRESIRFSEIYFPDTSETAFANDLGHTLPFLANTDRVKKTAAFMIGVSALNWITFCTAAYGAIKRRKPLRNKAALAFLGSLVLRGGVAFLQVVTFKELQQYNYKNWVDYKHSGDATNLVKGQNVTIQYY